MALITRSNGTLSTNQVTASWFNDFNDLLKGVMQDQQVTVQNNLVLTPVGGITAPTTACSVTHTTGTTLGIGTYVYSVSFLVAGYDGNGFGESLVGPNATMTTVSGSTTGSLTSIPIGPTGTTGRNIYRTKVGTTTQFFLHTINDNTTTTYTDTIADTSLSGGHLNASSNGGVLECYGINLAGNTPNLRSQSGWFGFLGQGADNKLAEITGIGNMIISGSSYGTTGGSISTGTGKVMDGFDVGEVYYCDKEYEQGTVVCPGPDGKMKQCTHDNCFAASVISHNPGLALGQENEDPGFATQLVAMAGRVNVKTSAHIGFRILVVSDGAGGVRPIYPDENAYTIGFTLNSSQDGMVGIMLRPMYCVKE